MSKSLAILVLATSASSCAIFHDHSPRASKSPKRAKVKPTSEIAAEVTAISGMIDSLYKSFCFDAGKQADWALMSSLIADGATFVSPINRGSAVNIQTTVDFLADFHGWVDSSQTGFHERVLETQIEVYGGIANALVTFEGFVPGADESAQTLGLDSLQLVLDQGTWKLASFATQYSNDRLPMPARFLGDD